MKVLVVCTGNFGFIKPFVSEQVEALNKHGINTEYYLIKGKGVLGYLKNIIPLRKKIKSGDYDLIHAHYGLSGLVASIQRIKPVIITFHTGEQFYWYTNVLSSMAVFLAKKCIFVSQSTYNDIFFTRASKKVIIPCGVDIDEFKPTETISVSEKIKSINPNKINILFASDFSKRKFYKNASLAIEAIKKVENANLIELKGCSREEVNLLLNACDLLLLTSKVEGSPQIVKEAMACNCPVVATNVGDIEELFDNVEGCFITSFDLNDVVENINKAILYGKRTNARARILNYYDNMVIAKRVIEVYKSILDKK